MIFSYAWSASSLSLFFCLSQNLNFLRKACAEPFPQYTVDSPTVLIEHLSFFFRVLIVIQIVLFIFIWLMLVSFTKF